MSIYLSMYVYVIISTATSSRVWNTIQLVLHMGFHIEGLMCGVVGEGQHEGVAHEEIFRSIPLAELSALPQEVKTRSR